MENHLAMRQQTDQPDRLTLWHILAGFGWGILVCLLLSLLTGCKTVQYIPVETVRTDTAYITKQQRDSIIIRDSIYVHEYQRGDTIYRDRIQFRDRWRDRWRTDTIYRSRTDSIAVPYPVEKPLTRWQRFCLDYGKMTTGATIALVLLLAIWAVKTTHIKM